MAEVTFGGSWDSGATITSGVTVKSDFVSFDLVEDEDIFLTFWAGPSQKTVLRKIGGQTTAWVINGDDQSETVDWEVLTISDTRRQLFAVFQLDVLLNSPEAALVEDSAYLASNPRDEDAAIEMDSRLIIHEHDGSDVVISWFAEEDQIYQLQWTESLQPGQVDWHDIGAAVQGNGDARVITNNTLGATRRFYRIQTIPH